MLYTCSECNKEFLNQFNYLKHKRATVPCKSTKKNRFGKLSCPRCPASFTRRDNLTRHVKTWHKNENLKHKLTRFYLCGIDTCEAIYESRSELIAHRKEQHSVQKDFHLVRSSHQKSCQLLRSFYPPSVKGIDSMLLFSYHLLVGLLTTLLVSFKHAKINSTVFLEMFKLDESGQVATTQVFPFSGKGIAITRNVSFKEQVRLSIGDMERSISEFLFQGSGWIAGTPLMMEAEVTKCQPLYGRGLPELEEGCSLHSSKFFKQEGIGLLLNDPNPNDGLCFYYGVGAGLMESSKQTDKRELEKVLKDIFGITSENKHTVPPMKVANIRAFEDKFNLKKSINVVYQDEDNCILPIYASKKVSLPPICLVLFHVGDSNTKNKSNLVMHYAYVPSPSRLFARREKGEEEEEDEEGAVKRTRNVHICFNCTNTIESKSAFLRHVRFCHENGAQAIQMPKEGDVLCFDKELKKHSKKFKSSFICIFDFESAQIPVQKPCSCSEEILENTRKWEEEKRWFDTLSESDKNDHLAQEHMLLGEEAGEEEEYRIEVELRGKKNVKKPTRKKEAKVCPHRTRLLREQPPIAYSLILCDREKKVRERKIYCGEDCSDHFVKTVLELSDKYLNAASPGVPIEPLTPTQKGTYYSKENCYLCDQWMSLDSRVLDHDHLTGKYLGTAHNICNLQRREISTLTCLAHNFSHYDSHFIVRSLNKYSGKEIFAIPLNGQRFKAFQIGRITFLDSFSFIPDSLAKCVDMLKESKNDFKMVRSELAKNDHQLELLTRKGVYPYSFATSLNILQQTTELPSIENFHNDLDAEPCKEDDYRHAQKVWKEFKIKNMLEYTKLYCFLDVLLLGEVVLDMRDNLYRNFGLDMVQYLSLPHMALDTMLKMTNAELELIADHEMSDALHKNVRGGHSFVNTRHAVKKDPPIKKGKKRSRKRKREEREEEEESCILYLDANNLYGSSMRYPLPYDGFRWMSAHEIQDFDPYKDIKFENGPGYILEVDLNYPPHLHKKHNAFPLAPEKMTITKDDLSFQSKEYLHNLPHLNERTYKSSKLTATFRDRKNYWIHGFNLKFALEEGLKLDRIHRIITFEQKDFMKDFIDHCTSMRSAAKTKTEQNSWKLIGESIFISIVFYYY